MSGDGRWAPNHTVPALPRTEKLSELVARQILHDIARRGLPPGAKLPPEAQMLAVYSVSRGSLREALRILEFQGLIRIRTGAGGGPVVCHIRSEDFARMSTMYFHLAGATIGELFDARLSMETNMAVYAARRRDPTTLAALEQHLDVVRTTELKGAARGALSREFHQIIAGMSGNRILDLLSRSIMDIYAGRVRALDYPLRTAKHIDVVHEEIARAIRAGEDVQAGELMRAHMQWFTERHLLANFPGLRDEIIDWR